MGKGKDGIEGFERVCLEIVGVSFFCLLRIPSYFVAGKGQNGYFALETH